MVRVFLTVLAQDGKNEIQISGKSVRFADCGVWSCPQAVVLKSFRCVCAHLWQLSLTRSHTKGFWAIICYHSFVSHHNHFKPVCGCHHLGSHFFFYLFVIFGPCSARQSAALTLGSLFADIVFFSLSLLRAGSLES